MALDKFGDKSAEASDTMFASTVAFEASVKALTQIVIGFVIFKKMGEQMRSFGKDMDNWSKGLPSEAKQKEIENEIKKLSEMINNFKKITKLINFFFFFRAHAVEFEKPFEVPPLFEHGGCRTCKCGHST